MDVVRALKFESPISGGTQYDDFPTEVDETQDYTIQKGVILSNTNTYIDKNTSGDIQFTDVSGTITLKKLKKKMQAFAIALG